MLQRLGKENIVDEIQIKGSTQEVNAWKRHIYFTYNGKDYEVNLFWDEQDGYELYWLEDGKSMRVVDGKGEFITAPEWAIKYDDTGQNNLSMDLDELTYEMVIKK
jgi:hypothetical protein